MPLLMIILLLAAAPAAGAPNSPLLAGTSDSPLLAGGQGGVKQPSSIFAAAPAAGAPYFVANVGQWQGDFQFKCEVGSTIYFVTPKGMTIDFRSYVGADGNPPAPSGFDNLAERGFSEVLDKHAAVPRRNPQVRGHVIQIHYSGLPPNPSADLGGLRGASGENKLPHYSNYFLSRDSTKWRSRVSHYENIIVPEVWPGIDVEYRADKLGVETIYHVKPGADPTQIQMEYLGLDAPLHVDAEGNLILSTSLGDLKEKAPFAFQLDGNVQKRVESSVQLTNSSTVRFALGAYDSNKLLTIDPLLYGTYLGGSGPDGIHAMDRDSEGNLLLTGDTGSDSFPVTPGAYQEERGESVTHVTKLNPQGAEILFATFIGGERANIWSIAVTTENDIWIAGNFETDPQYGLWPLTENAVDTIVEGSREGCFGRLSSDGATLEYSSYLGEAEVEQINAVATDEANLLYLVGRTTGEFLVTPNALFPDTSDLGEDGFLTVFDPSTNSIAYSSFIPGSIASALHVETPGRLWVAGLVWGNQLPVTPNAYQHEIGNPFDGMTTDGFFMAWDLIANTLLYSSYLGGNARDKCDRIFFTSETNHVYLTGTTSSLNFPVSINAFDTVITEGDSPYDAYIAVLDTITNEIVATYVGGSGFESAHAGLYADTHCVTLVSSTFSIDFPTTTDAVDIILNDDGQMTEFIPDYYVCRFNLNLTELIYGTYLGGNQEEYCTTSALWGRDSIWVAGGTGSTNFPTTPNALQATGSGWSDGGLLLLSLPSEPTHVGHEPPHVAAEFSLSAYPNPFNPATTLEFSLPAISKVELTVHDILGREISRDNLGRLTAGQHEIQINGSEWSSGIYFATLKTPARSQTTKLLLLK